MKKTTIYILLAFACLNCQCNLETDAHLAICLEEYEPQIEKLRNWDIYYEQERNLWSCRHWYERDSLLTFMMIHVDKRNNALSYDIDQLYEKDTAYVVQTAIRNISTLYEIQKRCRFDGIGTHEVYSDILAYDYVIILLQGDNRYQLLHVKDNNFIGRQLYKNWCIRNLNE